MSARGFLILLAALAGITWLYASGAAAPACQAAPRRDTDAAEVMTRPARLLCMLGLLGGFAGHGAIEAVRWWTPAMPADLRGFVVAMLVMAAVALAIDAARPR